MRKQLADKSNSAVKVKVKDIKNALKTIKSDMVKYYRDTDSNTDDAYGTALAMMRERMEDATFQAWKAEEAWARSEGTSKNEKKISNAGSLFQSALLYCTSSSTQVLLKMIEASLNETPFGSTTQHPIGY